MSIEDDSDATEHRVVAHEERRAAARLIASAATGRVGRDFQRTHLWRTTLNMRLKEAGVSQADRAGQFGHDVETNETSYTDKTDVKAVTAAYRQRHNIDLKSTGKATV